MPVDQSQPHANNIAIIGFVSALVVFFTIVACLYVLPFVIQDERHIKIEAAPTVQLDNLHAEETVELNQPAYVDKNAGVVRIPIALAMEKEAGHSWRQDLPVPANTFPTSGTVAAAPAPAGGTK